MPFGLDLTSVLVGIALALLLFLALDLAVAGGCVSAGMMGAAAGAMSTPWSWLLLVLLAVLFGLQFLR